MKKNGAMIVSIVFIVLIVVLISSYNSLVKKSEEVDNKFANIDTQLQRRADLIPNLVNTVKGYASHEQSVIDNVTSAREKLVNAKTDEEKIAANGELDTALARLLVVVENYPDLKANTSFIALQDELAGTENRISTARLDYNNAVKDYNGTIKTFPKNIIASMFNFKEKDYFEAKGNANEVPNVSFE